MKLLKAAGFPHLARAVMREIARVMVPFRRSIWHAADGREIRIMDMTDGHLLNSFLKCHRQQEFRPELYRALERECVRRQLPTDGTRPPWLKARNSARRELIERADREYLERLFPGLSEIGIPNQ